MPAKIYSKAGSNPSGYTTLRTNLCKNPALGVDSTGWALGFAGTGGAVATSRTSVLPISDVNWAFRVTWTTAPSTNVVYSQYGRFGSDDLNVTPGETVTFSTYGRLSWGGARAGINIVFWTAAGALVSETAVQNSVAVAANTWTRRSYTTVIPATAARATVRFYSQDVIPPVNGWLEQTAVLAETGAALNSYFDGAKSDVLYPPGPTARDYAWSGTAHASTSLERSLIYSDVYEAIPYFDPVVTASSRSRNRVHWIINRVDPDVSFATAGLRSGELEMFFAADEAAAATAEQMFRVGTTFRLVYPERLEWEMTFVVDQEGQIVRELDRSTANHWLLRVAYQEIAEASY